jgi:hypothetical protein
MEDFAGEVALETAHDLIFRFAFGEAPRHVVTGGLVTAQPHDQDDVQRRVPPRLSRCRMVLPLEASSGLAPQSLAKAPSLVIRSWLSPTAASKVAAVSRPKP